MSELRMGENISVEEAVSLGMRLPLATYMVLRELESKGWAIYAVLTPWVDWFVRAEVPLSFRKKLKRMNEKLVLHDFVGGVTVIEPNEKVHYSLYQIEHRPK